jgi:UbiD family decarboxylase
MPFSDLRAFIDAAVRIGEVKNIDGAHWNLEIGCLTEMMAEQDGPLLLFDNIVDYPKGFRIATNIIATARRFALALGLPTDVPKLEILKTWRNKIHDLKPYAPVEVQSGPISENILDGARVDLGIFPTPKWHEHDGGRYIGTGDMVVTKDPDSGWINVGTYRSCVVAQDRVTLWIIEHKHGKQIARKYWQAGRACPVAIVLGCEPATWMAAPSAAKAGVSEYEYAGALRSAPLEVIRAPFTGLPVPATAEIVIEGEMPPPEEESHAEGPFGEWPGYYTHSGNECVVRIKNILYRNDPILLGNPPLLPITERYGIPLYACAHGDCGHADRREHVPLLHRGGRRHRSGGFETGDLGDVHPRRSRRIDPDLKILDFRPRSSPAAGKARDRRFHHEPDVDRRLQTVSLARSFCTRQ